MAGGAFQFLVSGPSGPDYIIMASGDLVQWTDIATNLAPATPFQFNDAGAGSTNLFYRVRLAP